MSGLIGPTSLDVALGLALDVAWKTSIPLAAGLLLSGLPGTAADRHARLVAGCAAVPLVALLTVTLRGSQAAWAHAPAWPVLVWGVGAAVGLLSLARALWALHRLPTAPLSNGLRRSSAVRTPITSGWLRPCIVVPNDFTSWTPGAQQAALAHERAHIRRRDWLVSVSVWALSCVLWFSPVMWWTQRRLAVLAECAADDEVLRAGHNAADYASQLLTLGQSAQPGALALGASPLSTRIRALLDERPRAAMSLRSTALAVAALMLCTTAVAEVAAWTPDPPVSGCDPTPPAWQPIDAERLYVPYNLPGE